MAALSVILVSRYTVSSLVVVVCVTVYSSTRQRSAATDEAEATQPVTSTVEPSAQVKVSAAELPVAWRGGSAADSQRGRGAWRAHWQAHWRARWRMRWRTGGHTGGRTGNGGTRSWPGGKLAATDDDDGEVHAPLQPHSDTWAVLAPVGEVDEVDEVGKVGEVGVVSAATVGWACTALRIRRQTSIVRPQPQKNRHHHHDPAPSTLRCTALHCSDVPAPMSKEITAARSRPPSERPTTPPRRFWKFMTGDLSATPACRVESARTFVRSWRPMGQHASSGLHVPDCDAHRNARR